MLNKTIRILNFDDSLIRQQNLISRYQTEIIDLKDITGKARLWMDDKTKRGIEERIRCSAKDSITFIGSGDFHHISHLLINQFEEPLSIIIFDFHPDWETLPPRNGCGSWVSRTLENRNIVKCILIGVSSCDISSWNIQRGNIASLKDDRLQMYPYAHKPSLVFFRRVPQNASFKLERGLLYTKIYWDALQDKNLTDFFQSLFKSMSTKRVYLSIDKDCLKKEYALTNWEEGMFSLDELLLILRLIKENFEIAGVDITGDYSKISVSGRLKALCSRLDHPKDIAAAKMPESIITAVNEDTNLKILEVLNPQR